MPSAMTCGRALHAQAKARTLPPRPALSRRRAHHATSSHTPSQRGTLARRFHTEEGPPILSGAPDSHDAHPEPPRDLLSPSAAIPSCCPCRAAAPPERHGSELRLWVLRRHPANAAATYVSSPLPLGRDHDHLYRHRCHPLLHCCCRCRPVHGLRLCRVLVVRHVRRRRHAHQTRVQRVPTTSMLISQRTRRPVGKRVVVVVVDSVCGGRVDEKRRNLGGVVRGGAGVEAMSVRLDRVRRE